MGVKLTDGWRWWLGVCVLVVAAFFLSGTPAQAAKNIVYCQAGKICYGTSAADLIVGTSGPDTIYARDGRDEIYGNGGLDGIHGGALADHIYPGGGGKAGYNWVWGNGGADLIDATADTSGCPSLWVDGGGGTDTAWAFGFLEKRSVEHWGAFACP